MERLILKPESVGDLRPAKAARLVARLESTGEVVVRSHQPLVDGARELIARGFDPATPLTMRHVGKSYDSFAPKPLSHWAKWTYSEGEQQRLQRREWRPREEAAVAVSAEGQKSCGLDPAATTLPAGPEFASAA